MYERRSYLKAEIEYYSHEIFPGGILFLWVLKICIFYKKKITRDISIVLSIGSIVNWWKLNSEKFNFESVKCVRVILTMQIKTLLMQFCFTPFSLHCRSINYCSNLVLIKTTHWKMFRTFVNDFRKILQSPTALFKTASPCERITPVVVR